MTDSQATPIPIPTSTKALLPQRTAVLGKPFRNRTEGQLLNLN